MTGRICTNSCRRGSFDSCNATSCDPKKCRPKASTCPKEDWRFRPHPNKSEPHNRTGASPADWGDQWTWLALDSESKMILSHYIGRNTVSAYYFVHDLRERTLGTYQITADGLSGYVGAIEEWFGNDVHFAQLQKIYGRTEAGPEWYGGGTVIAAVPKRITGQPDWSRISTSHSERANLSVRCHLKRFCRKTNAISKRLSMLKAAVTLFVVWYDFCRVHQTLRVTPAMQSGITDHIWSVKELLCQK